MDQQVNDKKLKPSVVMLALAQHDRAYSSTAWCLAKAFSRQSRVYFIDNPFTISDFFKVGKKPQIRKRYNLFLRRKKEILQVENEKIHVVVSPLMIPVNWLPSGRIYRFLSSVNNWMLKRSLNRILKKHEVNNYIYINSYNPFYGADGDFDPAPAFYIYQTVDDISQSKYVAKHGPRLEREAMQKANACVTTSEGLRKKAAQIAATAVCIPNAADIQLFSKVGEVDFEKPRELEGEKRKVICYTGSIDHRLDYDILEEVARTHSDKLLLMVGPLMGPDCKESGFADLPNVLFTGRKELEQLPAYLQYAHCAIIPFKCNELTASIYPLKINEYLAAGKAVVATPFSEDICTFKEVVALALNGKEFCQAIDSCILADSAEERQKRIALAGENNWESRAYDFYELALGGGEGNSKKDKNSVYEKAVG